MLSGNPISSSKLIGGDWLLAVGCWLLAVGCWLLASRKSKTWEPEAGEAGTGHLSVPEGCPTKFLPPEIKRSRVSDRLGPSIWNRGESIIRRDEASEGLLRDLTIGRVLRERLRV